MRKLRVFLCHSSQDKPIVREIYQRLNILDWVDPWLDEEKLLPGQDWDMEIEKAVEAADVVIVCLSNNSVSKEGYIQRELKFALDIALEKPEGTIFIIPLRLEACELPRRLRSWQYVDYFPVPQRERAYQRLLQSLKIRLGESQPQYAANEKTPSSEMKSSATGIEEKMSVITGTPDHLMVSLPATPSGILELGWSILPILFFAMIGMYCLGYDDSEFSLLLGIAAVILGFFLGFNRQMAVNKVIKFSTIFFTTTQCLWIYGAFAGWDNAPILQILNGIAAWIACGSRVWNFRSARKPAAYSSIFFASFLALFGIKLIINFFNIYSSEIQTPIIVLGLIASVFWWFEQ